MVFGETYSLEGGLDESVSRSERVGPSVNASRGGCNGLDWSKVPTWQSD
jgi:hypothetical protein